MTKETCQLERAHAANAKVFLGAHFELIINIWIIEISMVASLDAAGRQQKLKRQRAMTRTNLKHLD